MKRSRFTDEQITTKGKARALCRSYLEALDREERLAKTLELSKRANKVPTVEGLLRERA